MQRDDTRLAINELNREPGYTTSLFKKARICGRRTLWSFFNAALDVTASGAELSSGRGGNSKNTLLKEHSLMCMKVSAGMRSDLNAARGLPDKCERATKLSHRTYGTSSESRNHNRVSTVKIMNA